MAIIINSVDSERFSLNGTTYNKIYQPMKSGTTNVSIYNTYDTRFKLLSSTHFGEFTINGSTYGNQADVIESLLEVVYKSIVNINTDSTGSGGGTWGTIAGTLSSQTDLQGALDGKSNTSHTHTFVSITNKPTTLSGYGITDSFNGTWASLSGKPSTFAPSAHTHTTSQITNLSSYTGFDSRYFTETQSDARFLAIGGTAVNSQLLDNVNSTQFLRSDQNDSTTGNLTAASFITGNWTIDQSGSSLVFKYNGATRFSLSLTGALSTEGNITANASL